MKPSLAGPLKATAAMIAIISGIMVSNTVSAEQGNALPTDASIAIAVPLTGL